MPHFHIEGPGFRASVAIETLEVIVGHAPARVRREAIARASELKTELLAKWLELNR